MYRIYSRTTGRTLGRSDNLAAALLGMRSAILAGEAADVRREGR